MRKIKIPIYNKKLWVNSLKTASGISVVVTTVLAFVDFDAKVKYIIGGVFLGVLLGIFVILLIMANKMEHLTLHINNSTRSKSDSV